ncbi:FAD-dependent oxidoreductase [Halobacteria archaeon HArc-gm2]|nr:FAD-dependent oxidoreductase [Halobacteria archaeon HArc-gm2]
MNSDTASRDDHRGTHEPIWIDRSESTDYDPLDGGLDVDVAVVGGGIVGVTTALKLKERGKSVALLERDRILLGVTGHTTAKVTALHGLIYDYLTDHVGEEQARLYAEANEAAIDDVAETVSEYDIDCDFERAPAYTYTPERAEDPDYRRHRREIRAEVEAARRAGLDASFVEATDLPYDVGGAVRVADQAHFHPRNYLLELARRVPGDGSHVFEETTVEDVDGGDPCTVETDRGTVTADDVVLATHFPIRDDAVYFARLTPKRSYVVAVTLNEDAPEGMYYQPYDPYFSVRPYPASDEPMILVGGQNHRTGEGGSTETRYERLEAQARNHFDVDSIEYRWSTQDYRSVDRVPFVGPAGPGTSNVYVATGFGGWGMTNGTAASILLADLITGRGNSWESVYTPTRLRASASKTELVSHNAHSMTHLAKDVVRQRPDVDLDSLDAGEADVFDGGDDPVAVYRDDDGDIHAVSAVCTHMGCQVSWNDGERSWDCACHGSRFDVDGTVLYTPASDPLEPIDLSDVARREPPARRPDPDAPDRDAPGPDSPDSTAGDD